MDGVFRVRERVRDLGTGYKELILQLLFKLYTFILLPFLYV